MTIDTKRLRELAKDSRRNVRGEWMVLVPTDDLLALLDELEAARAEIESLKQDSVDASFNRAVRLAEVIDERNEARRVILAAADDFADGGWTCPAGLRSMCDYARELKERGAP